VSALIPWTLLDTAEVPGDGGVLRLLRRGAEFSIRLGHNELMNSRVHGSEEALASIALEKIGNHKRPQILIGGLGMGFTLRAVLRLIGPEAGIVVAELAPAVVAWNLGLLAGISDGSLSDARVSIRQEDVGGLIRLARAAYDAILLDVDNGPEALTRKANDRLYDWAGLDAIYAALRPRGVLGVWSAGRDENFTKRLRESGFEVNEVRVRARGARGGAHQIIWIAART
jgi:spermidine synthase